MGIMVIASAGNHGPACETVLSPPAIYEAVLSVGATNSSDVVVSYSSRGPVTVDGSNRIKPDLVAPGSEVVSSWPGDTYLSLGGTSMAAPHVAGGVALLWSAEPELQGEIDESAQLLFSTAQLISSSQYCGDLPPAEVPNNTFGWGRLDILAAVDEVAPGVPIRLPLLVR
jgi:subtilisin family serine protease